MTKSPVCNHRRSAKPVLILSGSNLGLDSFASSLHVLIAADPFFKEPPGTVDMLRACFDL